MSGSTIIPPSPTKFAIFSLVAGMIGWFASFELLTEYLHVLKQPGYSPNCNISVMVSCSTNMGSPQGSLLGFSNTILGVAGFMAPIIIGVSLLAGAQFSAWFWRLYQLGLTGGFVFVCWLFWESVFSLGKLCPWCMVVWAVTIPLFWITLLRPTAVGIVAAPPAAQRLTAALYRWSWVIIALCYVTIAFIAQLQLDWFAEFSRY